MTTLMKFCAFLLPLVAAAAEVDRHHHYGQWKETHSERPTLYSGGNAGIWDDTDWIAIADDELEEAIQVTSNFNTNKAKNVILFIGDGMGFPTLAAARLYNAENRNLKKREIYLTWEKFPHVGISRTYNVDRSTSDSAATGTAYLCGVKANFETVGVNDKVQLSDCAAVNENTKVRSINKDSISEGKWTGFVTTTRVTHASPAAAYANTANRYWETYFPSEVPGLEGCVDIAKQLVEENKELRVILGGGRQMFLPNYTNADYNNETGKREDREDLIGVWRNDHENRRGKFVMNKSEFDKIVPEDTDYLLGLLSKSHMDYEVDRNPSEQPSLSEMTEKAIRILQRGPKGYFLFVEGGRIDISHHEGVAFKALNETIALSDAVQKAMSLTDVSDTLIIVTADHSHLLTFGGYSSFKTSVFDASDIGLADDGKPFLQLNYANGPGFYKHRTADGTSVNLEVSRKNLTGDDEIFTPGFLQDSGVPVIDGTSHGGEDVAIFARGPMAHLIHGVHEQNYINRLMKFSSCMGRDSNRPHCVSANEATTSSIDLTLVVSTVIFSVIRQMSPLQSLS